MDVVLPVTVEDKCSKCGRCVSVTIWSNAQDFDAPLLDSECKDATCPINISYKPNDIQKVYIHFIPCVSNEQAAKA